MKRIYLYIAILISLVANIFFFYSIMKKNDNKSCSAEYGRF